MKVTKILNIYSKDLSLSDKVEFICKSYNSMVLPKLDQESMNSQGQTRVSAVIDYLFYSDNLCIWVKNSYPK
jgi:hypothetical protein